MTFKPLHFELKLELNLYLLFIRNIIVYKCCEIPNSQTVWLQYQYPNIGLNGFSFDIHTTQKI